MYPMNCTADSAKFYAKLMFDTQFRHIARDLFINFVYWSIEVAINVYIIYTAIGIKYSWYPYIKSI